MKIKMKTKQKQRIFFAVIAMVLMVQTVFASALSDKSMQVADNLYAGGRLEDVTGQYDTDALRASAFSEDVLLNTTQDASAKRWVIVEFSDASVSEVYFASDEIQSAMTLTEFSRTAEAQTIADELLSAQNKVLNRVKKRGIGFTEKYNYTLLSNAAAIEITLGELDALKAVKGVKSVSVSERYAQPQAVTENDANVYGTGIYDTADLDYSGKGMLVAVLDTGCDESHPAFRVPINSLIDEENAALGSYPLVTKTEVAANVFTGTGGLYALDKVTTVDDVYYSEKIPFAYDYADKDANVFPEYSSHGTHVAGIIGGGEILEIKDADGRPVTNKAGEELNFVGVAPNAQLAICKVFTDNENSEVLGGAETVDIVAALEDCVKLGVDVINMSLGSSAGFSEASDEYMQKQVYASIKEAGISLVVAASNDYSAGYGSAYGTNLTSAPDAGTVGAPSTYDGALSVASINGQRAPYLIGNPGTANESYAYFTEASDGYGNAQNFIDGVFAKKGVTGDTLDIEYVVIPGYGKSFNYAGKNVVGKIALVSRGGEVTFQEKQEAAKDSGAAGVVIYNNVSGVIRMSLGEDRNPIPACSITMDIASGLLAGAVGGKGTFRIDRSQSAGPFMSDFSSWGPTPDLRLKPEITAHGGEIISAVSGGWAEYSGTSMASPNMAGAMSLILQYITDNATELGVAGDKPAMVALANQLVMSTATIARNEFNDPYSPRKQGAGLANISNVVNTDAYVSIMGANGQIKDKTKIELGDDRTKKGVYQLDFIVNNISDRAKSYTVDIYTMTETVASDGRTVAERSKMLSDSKVTVDGGATFTVAAGSSATKRVTVELSDAARKYLDDSFANGMYVEGFVRLFDQDTDANKAIDLNVPWLAFYGDWYASPMMDITSFELADAMRDDSIDDRDKPLAQVYATTPYGLYWNRQYILPLGQYIYTVPDGYKEIYADEDKAAVSMFDTAGRRTISELYGIYAGLLRGAKNMEVSITDTLTGEVVYAKSEENVRKAYAGGGGARPGYVQLEYDVYKNGLPANREYEVSFSAVMDSLGDFEGGYTDSRPAPGVGNSAEDKEALRQNSYSFRFKVDNEAPTITDYRVRYAPYTDGKLTKYRTYLDIDVHDNQYAQSVMLCYGESKTNTLQLLTGDIVPVYGEKNSMTTVTIEITDHFSSTEDIYIQVDDYALNARVYRLSEYTSFAASAEFPESIQFETDSVTVAINEAMQLKTIVTPEGSAQNNLAWSSSNPSIVKVQNGEIIGLKEGTATVTVYASEKPTGGVSATITVNVTAEVKVPSIGVSKLTLDLIKDKNKSVVNPTNKRVEVHPGESFNLRVIQEPWYYSERLNLVWKSSNSSVVEVNSQTGRVRTMKEGRAMITATLILDGKESVYTVSTTFDVGPEFDVSGGTLYGYHGWGGKVTIPKDLNVYYIREDAFKDNTNITELEITAPTFIIETRAFENMTALERVILPASMEYIEREAFYNCRKLTRVDSRAGFLMLGSRAFYGCSSLKYINNLEITDDSIDTKTVEVLSLVDDGTMFKRIAPRITGLKDQVFYNCTALETIDLTEVRGVGDYVFDGCTALESVTLSIDTPVGKGMFFGCSALSELTYTDVTDIAVAIALWSEAPFEGCALSTIKIKEGSSLVTDTDGNIFSTAEREELLFASPAAVTNEGKYVLPATVERIGNNALSGLSKMKTIDFGVAPLQSIGDYAFSGSGLTSVTLPATVSALGKGVFKYCESLEEVDLSLVALTTIPEQSFYGAKVSTLTLNKTVLTTIGDAAFYAAWLTELDLSDTAVTSIGSLAFADCFLLKTIKLPALTQMGNASFALVTDLGASADSLMEVSIADGATTLGSFAFASVNPRRSFTTFTLPASLRTGLTVLKDGVFMNCAALTALPFAALTKIGDGAFLGCTALSTLDTSAVTEIGAEAFFGCTALSNLELGSVAGIGTAAFYGCTALTSAQLTAISYIGDEAFSGSGISQLTLGTALTDIGAFAFFEIPVSGTIDVPTSVERIGEGAFAGMKSLTALAISGGATTNGTYYVTDGVMYYCSPNGGKQLFAYPAGKTGQEFTAGNDIIRVAAAAFYGAKNLQTVTLGESVKSIGDKAFYGAAVKTYVFDTLAAPTLEFVYVDVDSLSSSSALYKIFSWDYLGKGEDKYYANFSTYMAFLMYPRESGVKDPQLTVCYPSNARGFDSLVWDTYFAKVEHLPLKAEENTLLAKTLIEALPSADTVLGLIESSDQAAAKAVFLGYAEASAAARAAYNNISTAEQISTFIPNVNKLFEVEAAVRKGKMHFGIALTIEWLTVMTEPTKTVYTAGESFDPAGLVLRAVYDDGSEELISEGFTFDNAPLELDQDRIIVTYNGKTCMINITTKAAEEENGGGRRTGCGGCKKTTFGGGMVFSGFLLLCAVFIVGKKRKDRR